MLLLAVLLTLLAVVLAVPLSHWLGRHAGWLLWIPLAASAWALSQAMYSSGGEVIEYYPWIPDFFQVGFHLRLDGLSLVFSLLVTIIGAGVLFYSAKYLGTTKIKSFYLSMTTFALAMLVLVLANDVMVLYVAWEATTLASFFLIARSGSHARKPAVRTLLVTILGGLALLAAVAIMIAATGTTVITEILVSDLWSQPTSVTWIILMLVLAAFTKSAQFPFQSWLPDSMVAISPVSAYLHAAAMVKAGIYLLLLFSPVLAGNTLWLVLLVGSGLLTALMGAVSALRRYDLKELLAYSTMSQLGYLVALIGLGTPAALTAAIVHTIAHALFKSALFLAVGVIDHQAETRDMRMLTVRNMAMPATLAIIIVGSASMAGLPPLLGFVSKESLFAAFLAAPLPGAIPVVLTAIVVVIAVCTFAYSGRLVLGAMGRYRSPKHWINTPRGTTANRQTVSEASVSFWGYPAVNASLSLILGILPFVLTSVVAAAASAALGAETEVDLALWHGINPAFGLSMMVIVLGPIAVWYLPVIEAFLVPRPLSFSGLGVVEKLRQATIEFGAMVGSWTSGLNPGRHLVVPSVLLAGLAIAGWLTIDALPAQQANLTRWTDWLLVALVAVGVVATIRARTRLAAIAVLGTVGFSVTLWFFALGSVDVALTQLLVEILTVVVMVLLLHRLPKTFGKGEKLSKVGVIAALAAGFAAFAGTYALTGRRGMSDPAQYFTQQGTEVTGGNNLVNVILVEFRALDTLGELTVLGVAGVAVAALLASRSPSPVRNATILKTSPLSDPGHNATYLRTFSKIAVPVLVIVSLVLLIRGHNEPGGGFIAALLTGSVFAVLYLAAPSNDTAPIRWPYMGLTGAGVALGSAVGIYGLIDGSFLKPIYLDLFGFELNTSLLFDIGVYFAVLGLILGVFNMLGSARGLAKSRESAPDAVNNPAPETSTTTHRTYEREGVK